MTLTYTFALLALAIVLIVFLAVSRVRGLRLALLAGGVALVGLFSLFVAMLMFITSQM